MIYFPLMALPRDNGNGVYDVLEADRRYLFSVGPHAAVKGDVLVQLLNAMWTENANNAEGGTLPPVPVIEVSATQYERYGFPWSVSGDADWRILDKRGLPVMEGVQRIFATPPDQSFADDVVRLVVAVMNMSVGSAVPSISQDSIVLTARGPASHPVAAEDESAKAATAAYQAMTEPEAEPEAATIDPAVVTPEKAAGPIADIEPASPQDPGALAIGLAVFDPPADEDIEKAARHLCKAQGIDPDHPIPPDAPFGRLAFSTSFEAVRGMTFDPGNSPRAWHLMRQTANTMIARDRVRLALMSETPFLP